MNVNYNKSLQQANQVARVSQNNATSHQLEMSTGIRTKNNTSGIVLNMQSQSSMSDISQISRDLVKTRSVIDSVTSALTTIKDALDTTISAVDPASIDESNRALEAMKKLIDNTALTCIFNGNQYLQDDSQQIKVKMSLSTDDTTNFVVNLIDATSAGLKVDNLSLSAGDGVDEVNTLKDAIGEARDMIAEALSEILSANNTFGIQIGNLDVLNESLKQVSSTLVDADVSESVMNNQKEAMKAQLAVSILTQVASQMQTFIQQITQIVR
jgi:flagellin-like hook-associated protein FlgL